MSWLRPASGSALRRAILSFFVLLTGFCGTSQAQTGQAGLRLKSPFAHQLAAASSNPAGTLLATISKGGRISILDLRDLASGKPLPNPETMWLPQTDGRIGRGYAVAMHKSDRFVAASLPPLVGEGTAAYAAGTAEILLLVREPERGGKTARRIERLPAPVASLSFSPDGSTLAALFADGCGLRLWDITVSEDDLAYGIVQRFSNGYGGSEEHAAACRNASPDAARPELPDGADITFVQRGDRRFVVTSGETGVRIYERRAGTSEWREGRGASTRDLGGLVSPGKMSFDGENLLAVGDSESLRVSVLRLDDSDSDFGPVLTPLPTRKFDHLLHSTQISPTGSYDADFRTVHWDEWTNGKALLVGGWLNITMLNDNLLADHFGAALAQFGNVQQSLAIPADVLLTVPPEQPLQPFTHFSMITGRRDGINSFLSGPGGQTLAVSQRALLRMQPSRPRQPIWTADPVSVAGSLDFRDSEGGLHLSADGGQLAFTAQARGNRSVGLIFSLAELRQMEVLFTGDAVNGDDSEIKTGLTNRVPATFRSAQVAVDGVSPSPDHRNIELGKLLLRLGPRNANPKEHKLINGRPLSFDEGLQPDPEELSFSMAQLVPRQGEGEAAGGYAWATSRALHLVDKEGRVTCRLELDSGATRLVGSGDGRIIVGAHQDGTLRWYRVGSQRQGQGCLIPILSLYAEERSDQSWSYVAWLPDGRFVFRGTGGLESMLCWYQKNGHSGSCDSGAPLYKEKKDEGAVRNAITASAPAHETASELKQDFSVEFQQPRAGKDEFTLDDGERVSFTISPVSGGRLPRFALVFGRSKESGIIDVRIGARDFGTGAFPVQVGTPVEVTLTLPGWLRSEENQQWKLCLEFYEEADPDGRPINDTRLRPKPAAEDSCTPVTWKGEAAGRPDRKLWGVILGFSGSKRSSGGLNFAHDDALDFARLLLETFVAQKRDRAMAAKSDFSGLQLDILITPPGAWRSDQTPSSPKLHELQNRYEKLQQDPAIAPKINLKFHQIDMSRDSASTAEQRPTPIRNIILNDMFSRITSKARHPGQPLQDDMVRDEDVVLFYYSGHGFTGVQGLDAGLRFAMPDANVNDFSAHLSFGDLVWQLKAVNGTKLMIIDACRTPIGSDRAMKAFAPHKAQDQLREELGAIRGTWHILLSSAEATSSYEQSVISFAKLYPTLWSETARDTSEGNGIFSLTMLRALTCPEAGCIVSDCAVVPKRIAHRSVMDFYTKHTQSSAFTYWPLIRRQLAQTTPSAQMPKILADSTDFEHPLHLRTLPVTAPWCFPH